MTTRNKTINQANELIAGINAGKGTLGKLAKDEQMARKIDDTVTRLDHIIDRLDKGEGTAGKFLVDPALYDNCEQAAGGNARPDRRGSQGPEEVSDHPPEAFLGGFQPTSSGSPSKAVFRHEGLLCQQSRELRFIFVCLPNSADLTGKPAKSRLDCRAKGCDWPDDSFLRGLHADSRSLFLGLLCALCVMLKLHPPRRKASRKFPVLI